ncbi:MAG: hypothetical protein QOJ63_283 [Solirubrobacteraceae bacterium]|nr:hypothetical protein [Solirubrobacteraceae bacterium]
MRYDPQRLLRGFGKLVAVVLAAGLAGAGIGIGLAQLTGNGGSTAPLLPATTSGESARASTSSTVPTQTVARSKSTTTARTSKDAQTRTTTTSRTQTTAAPSRPFLVPRVQILSVQLKASPTAVGHVTVRVRVINRGAHPLAVAAPVLLSGNDEIPRDSANGSTGRPLLKKLAVGSSATSELRFTTPSAVTKRLSTTRRARLRIAKRSIVLKLATGSSSG